MKNLKVVYLNMLGVDYIDTEELVEGILSPMNDFVFKSYSYLSELDKKIINDKFPKLVSVLKDLKGRPDFVCINGDKILFIEVKSKDDGLKSDQLKWIKNHPEYNVVVLFVIQKMDR